MAFAVLAPKETRRTLEPFPSTRIVPVSSSTSSTVRFVSSVTGFRCQRIAG
jgi:hypothetical protein